MAIVLNTNASATEATFNLSKANDNLRVKALPVCHLAIGSPNQLMMLAVWLLHTSCNPASSVRRRI